jgi:hypothetical protein
MKALALAAVAAVTLGGCGVTGLAGLLATATNLGVSPAVQQACVAAVAQEVPGLDADTDFGAAMDRLKVEGKACLIAAVKDVLTARVVLVPPATAGDVIPADPVAEAAIR